MSIAYDLKSVELCCHASLAWVSVRSYHATPKYQHILSVVVHTPKTWHGYMVFTHLYEILCLDLNNFSNSMAKGSSIIGYLFSNEEQHLHNKYHPEGSVPMLLETYHIYRGYYISSIK